jgi:uncharacterized membrane protein YccC
MHSFKTALATLLGLWLCDFFHIDNSPWVVLTIIIVMGSQKHFGGALKESYFRATGTILGAIIAFLTLFFAKHNPYAIAAVIFCGVWWFSYIANSKSSIKSAGILGAITITTILITQESTMQYAAMRVIEILLGIVIALFVSKVVFPIHARSHLLNTYANTFRDMVGLYEIMYDDCKVRDKLPRVQKFEENIVNNFSEIQTLIPNSKNEMSRIPFNKAIAESILTYQRRLFRSMIFMYQAINKEPEKFPMLKNIVLLTHFNEELVNIVKRLADSIEAKGVLPSMDSLNLSLVNLEKSIWEQRQSRSMDILINIDTVLFCTKHIVDEISVLQMLIGTYRSL